MNIEAYNLDLQYRLVRKLEKEIGKCCTGINGDDTGRYKVINKVLWQ